MTMDATTASNSNNDLTVEENINIDMLDSNNDSCEATSDSNNASTCSNTLERAKLPVSNDMIKVEVTEEQGRPYLEQKKAMSLDLLLNGADADSDDFPSDKDSKYAMSPRSDGRSSPDDTERCLVPSDYGTPPSTPYSNGQSAQPQRAVCSICKSESGRCHASDPASMQTFFASSLGYEGVLSSADWLCMKCYSKWYNRCKRKAAAAAASGENGVALVPSTSTPPTSTPPRRKRVREGKDKEHTRRRDRERTRERQMEIQRQAEKMEDNDTDSDDALLLTRMTNSYHHPTTIPHHNTIHSSLNGMNFRADTPPAAFMTPVHTPPPSGTPTPTATRDLELEVDELHTELHRARAEMMRLAQEIARRDEQMEGMLKFVKTEMAAMHGLLKDIADVRAYTHHGRAPLGGGAHVFHLNGKVLDNPHMAANGCMIPRPLTDALMHVHPQNV